MWTWLMRDSLCSKGNIKTDYTEYTTKKCLVDLFMLLESFLQRMVKTIKLTLLKMTADSCLMQWHACSPSMRERKNNLKVPFFLILAVSSLTSLWRAEGKDCLHPDQITWYAWKYILFKHIICKWPLFLVKWIQYILGILFRQWTFPTILSHPLLPESPNTQLVQVQTIRVFSCFFVQFWHSFLLKSQPWKTQIFCIPLKLNVSYKSCIFHLSTHR